MALGLVFLGMALGLCGTVMALTMGHPVWLALLVLPAFGSGSVMLFAAGAMMMDRTRAAAGSTPACRHALPGDAARRFLR